MKRIVTAAIAAALLLAGCAAPAQSVSSVSPSAVSAPSPETAAPSPSAQNENMVKNGDFSSGTKNWRLYLANGGKAALAESGGEGVVKIASCGTTDYAVQLYYDGFKLETGGKYRFAFDAKAGIGREIAARLQVNGGDYHPYIEKKLDIGTQMKRYEIVFTMEEGTDPAPRLCFNIGTPAGQDAPPAHDIHFDNVEVTLIDGSNILAPEPEPERPDINVSQIGYEPEDVKIAVVRGDKHGGTFKVVGAGGAAAFEGTLKGPVVSGASGETNYLADFSALKTQGTYTIISADARSYPFEIREGVYAGAFKTVFKMLYLQRCGTELPAGLAGGFAHKACHTGKAVIYGTDKTKDVSGGWHDAGDYGRYVVSGAKAAADLLFAYQDFPEALSGDDYGIPESGNGVPDVLDEARYELEWMLKMQDDGGGVYHKVTGLVFPGEVMPEDETAQLYIMPVSAAATGDFAAVMAMSHNAYKDFDKKFAAKCLAAAKKAWGYLETHGAVNFKNPADVLTGEYGDGNDNDERCWAAAALYAATNDKKYLDEFNSRADIYSWVLDGYGWQNVGGYGNRIYLSLDPAVTDPERVSKIKDAMKAKAGEFLANSGSDGYGVSLGTAYPWGSNMTVCDNASYLYLAAKLFANADYASAAQRHISYIFGTNPMSVCYVTGMGTASPKNTHHRPSMAAGKPMPGMLAGGPNGNLEDPYAKAVLAGSPPAKCYADNSQSYSTNEVAVYWNSALIRLLAYKLG